MIRAHLSKVAPADELGAIFSLVASLEAAVPLISTPIMTLVYNSTLTTFPGAILLVSMGLYCAITVILSIVYYICRNSIPSQTEDTQNILGNEEPIASTA